jgi:hypothetical protein
VRITRVATAGPLPALIRPSDVDLRHEPVSNVGRQR